MSDKKHNRIRTRDYNLLLILKGATKAGIHKDHKKENDRNACREWSEDNDYMDVDVGFRGIIRRSIHPNSESE